ncbi:hypothetical protein VNO78_34025 [Psophocarpus tetragonolobus]|uniref:Uncharacterized protein n=1 Tax=Psophocarpus tetragonolobus TaxID=3891 RepID=A0AAN9RQH4_PSOTE
MTVLPAPTITGAVENDRRIAFSKRRCMSFCMPCFPSETASSCWWNDLRSPAKKDPWWCRYWKSFIRHLNRSNNYKRPCSFRYDPLSYALNFDDGTAAGDDDCGYKGFSARFASVPLTEKAIAVDSLEEHVQTVAKFDN